MGTHKHAMHAGGRFGTSVARLGEKPVTVNSAFSLPGGMYMSREGNLRLARGELQGFTKGLKLESYRSAPRGYYDRILLAVIAVNHNAAVSLPGGGGGHKLDTDLPSKSFDTSIGIKQNI